MARKRKPSARQKRQEVTDPSGWTHIVKGPQSTMASISTRPFQRLETSFTVEDYSNQFQKLYTTHWQASPCLSSLKRVFEQDILTAQRIILTKCVCLGLGSLTMGTPDSSYQLAALITMLEILSMKFDIYEVIFQDPAFNAQDKTFLTNHGYTVLEDPEAISKIDDNTFLFAPHLEVGVLATALEHSIPAVCISNNISYYFDGLYRSYAEARKPNSPGIFERYLSQTVSMAMPEVDRATWACETKIYWLNDTPDRLC